MFTKRTHQHYHHLVSPLGFLLLVLSMSSPGTGQWNEHSSLDSRSLPMLSCPGSILLQMEICAEWFEVVSKWLKHIRLVCAFGKGSLTKTFFPLNSSSFHVCHKELFYFISFCGSFCCCFFWALYSSILNFKIKSWLHGSGEDFQL